MNFDEYQKLSNKFDCYDKKDFSGLASDPALVEKIMGLTGEAGETADKFKKIIRDHEGKFSEDNKNEIKKELGDVLWYLAAISDYLDIPLSEVAKGNIDKLQSRADRNKIHGAGDNR